MLSFLYLGNINRFAQINDNETLNNLADEHEFRNLPFLAVLLLLLPSFFVLLLEEQHARLLACYSIDCL